MVVWRMLGNNQHLSRAQKISNFHQQRIARIQKAAQKEYQAFKKEPLFILGLGLYWAEGFKKDHRVGLCNTDPQLMQIFLKWCRQYLYVKNEQFEPRISIHISHQLRLEEIAGYWSRSLDLDAALFRKPFLQKTAWLKIYPHPQLYYGVLRVYVVKSRHLLYKIDCWIGLLKSEGVS